MNILYIHGFGSDCNSYTGNSLKKLFPEHHWILQSFDLLNVKLCNVHISRVLEDENIDIVVSSSLGCIYNLFIKKNEKNGKIVKKILINPCCFPSRELGRLAEIPGDVRAACEAVEFNVYQVHCDNTFRNVFGIFTRSDELLQYHDFFVGKYGNAGSQGRVTASNCIWADGPHSGLELSVLKDTVQQGFDYFSQLDNELQTPPSPPAAKSILYIDMDGTLVDWKSGENRLTEMEKLQYDGAYDEVPGIFSRMEPMAGAVEAFVQLQKKFDVYILSTSPWRNASAPSDKLRWVQRYFGIGEGTPAYKRLILSHHKELNRGDIIIDDRIDKNGASAFRVKIPFGQGEFRTWPQVVAYLMNPTFL